MVVIQRQIDATDRRLLDELQEDARMTHAELGRRVGLSPPAVTERVRRLTDEGSSAASTPTSTPPRWATSSA